MAEEMTKTQEDLRATARDLERRFWKTIEMK